MRKYAIVILLVLALAASAIGAPRNIILMIGDGMGLAHIAAARLSSGPGSTLAMDSMPVSGFVTTYSANAIITDSAAAATAYATGTKTNNGMVATAPSGQTLRTIVEAARDFGKSTGIVTTTAVVDATPACFASHAKARSEGSAIAEQLASSGVNVLFGGGRGQFIPKGEPTSARPDDRNLLTEAAAKGYKVISTSDELRTVSGPRVIGLFAPGNLTEMAPEPPLSDLTTKAIELLSPDKDGFFLMVEGGMIDKYAHGHDFDHTVRDTLEFDKAVARALDFARRDKHTLVIVTADHETGGLTLLTDAAGALQPMWSTGGHTAIPVALYAFGPDADQFAGLVDNTYVANTMVALWRLKIGLQGSTGIPTISSSSVTALPSAR